MSFWLKQAKVFALLISLFLFFGNFSFAPAQDSIYELRAGTKIRLRMETEINSKVASADDTFTALVAEPVVVRDAVVLPAGTLVEGRVVKVERAAAGGQNGKMLVRFETLFFSEKLKRAIDGALVDELKAESSRTGGILSIVGGTALGALIGAVTKTDNGTLIGAGVGAGAGTGVALLRKGKDVRIKTAEEFVIELKKDVTLPVRDY